MKADLIQTAEPKNECHAGWMACIPQNAKRSPRQGGFADTTTMLYDLATDPGQTAPFRDAGLEARMCDLIRAEMTAHEAPAELYARFDLT